MRPPQGRDTREHIVCHHRGTGMKIDGGGGGGSFGGWNIQGMLLKEEGLAEGSTLGPPPSRGPQRWEGNHLRSKDINWLRVWRQVLCGQ